MEVSTKPFWVPMITVLPAFFGWAFALLQTGPSLPRGKRGGCYYILKGLVGTTWCTFNAVVREPVKNVLADFAR